MLYVSSPTQIPQNPPESPQNSPESVKNFFEILQNRAIIKKRTESEHALAGYLWNCSWFGWASALVVNLAQ